MKNPSVIGQPKLTNPLPTGQGNGRDRKKRNKGNQSYLRFRRKMRKDMFGRMP